MGILKILLVEDLPSDIEFIKYEIKRSGIAFVTENTASSDDFLKLLSSFSPDIILSDYSMPRFTGMDALLLRNQFAPATPFILVTGSTNEEIAVECMKAGADDYLIKDNLTRLVPAIIAAIDRKKSQKAKKDAEEALQHKLIALTNPLEDTTDIKFEDLFDVNEIQKIQDALSSAWGVASLITDSQGRPITKASNFCRLCKDIIRKTEKGLANCYHSDAALGRTNPGGAILQPCLSGGLWDGGASICVGDQHIASWLVGQVLDESVDRQTILAYGNEIGADPREFRSALEEVPSLPKEQFAKICDALFLVAEQLSSLALKNLQQARTISERNILENRFRNAQRIAQVGNWELDLKTKRIWGSEEAFSVYGFTRKENELTLEQVQNAVLPEFRAKMDELLQRLITSGAEYNAEYQIRRANDGEIRYVHSKAELLYNSQQVPVLVAGVIQDITNRKNAEIALLESEERFKALFDKAPVGYQSLNEDAIITEVNETWLQSMGYSRDEVIGKWFGELLLPEYIDTFTQRFELFKRTGKIHSEYVMVKKNRANAIVAFDGRIALTSTGVFKQTHCVLTDITEQRRAEDKVKELSMAVEQSPAAIIITNLSGNIEYVNRTFEEITGYSATEVLGKKPSVLKSGHTTNEEYANLWETILSGTAWRGEFLNKKKSGELLWSDALITPIRNDRGEIKQFLGIQMDITERKRVAKELNLAKEKAEEMSRLKSSFLANMSHELRTPMMGILGYSEILSTEAIDASTKRFADTIHSSGTRLLETLNLILDLSRIEAGKLEINFTKLNIVPIIREIHKVFEPAANKKKLLLKIDIPVEEIYLPLDERMFREILNNLINNAIKYTMVGSVRLEVVMENSDGNTWVAIKIKDTGLGISEENLNVIFEEFRQVSEGLGRRFEGTGLGLTITKKFTEMMNGQLSVESTFEVGTTFTVRFQQPGTNDETSPYPSDGVSGSGSTVKKPTMEEGLPKVLYVEDDPIASNLVELMLKRICSIDFAETSEEALKKVNTEEYAAILMDINLGKGTDGVQTTKMIRQIKSYQKVPIIAITAFAMVGDKEEFLEAGCTDYISKPFDKSDLIALMTDVLQRKI